MPQIWDDVFGAETNLTRSNNQSVLRFQWHFVTFSNESQVEVYVRWRRANQYGDGAPLSIRDRMRRDEAQWTTGKQQASVTRREDMTTWVLVDQDPGAGVNMQLVPPAESLRRYYPSYHIDFPINTLPDGFYIIQAGIKSFADSAGVVTTLADADVGWTTHRIEVNQFDDIQHFQSSANSQTKEPRFENEGVYAIKVEVMSEAGITAETSEVQFDVWETNKYYHDGNMAQAVPEGQMTSNGVVRLKRT